jgi:hypothetical protein
MGPVAFVCAETFRKHRSFLWLFAQAASAIFFRGTGVLTQDLVLESLQKPFFVIFFPVRVSQIICLSWLQTVILLICAS